MCNLNGVLLRVSCNKLVTSFSGWYALPDVPDGPRFDQHLQGILTGSDVPYAKFKKIK